MQRDSTVDSDVEHSERPHGRPVPGLLVLLESEQPVAIPMPLPPRGLELGRGVPDGRFEQDDEVSRAHAAVKLEQNGLRITDLGSRNGTFVDGARLAEPMLRELPVLLRIGRSVLWAVPDARPFARVNRYHDEGPVLGMMSRAFGEIALAAKAGDTLLITGESGSVKELAARAFHAAGRGGDAPFVAVNCAAIPEGLAERLLFGAKRGAYSGAVDADGYVQQAHGGTLFLDEVAELDAQVQAKLLRVLESREVLALGATKPQPSSSGSARRATSACAMRSLRAASAPTSTTASAAPRSRSLRCASASTRSRGSRSARCGRCRRS